MTDTISSQVVDAVKAHMREVIDQEIVPATTLLSIGMDSLDRTEIAMTLEDKFNIANLTDHCGQWETVGDIIAAVVQHG